MVEFGSELSKKMYTPWREYYVQYDKLKRVITRNRFILDSRKAKYVDPATTSLSRSNSLLRSNSKLAFMTGISTPPQALSRESSKVIYAPASPPLSRESSKVNYGTNDLGPSLDSAHGDTQTSTISTEMTPLTGSGVGNRLTRSNTMLDLISSGFDVNSPYTASIPLEDFFEILTSEVEKINAFFATKMSELRNRFDAIGLKRNNKYRLHHTGGDLVGDLKEYRSIYNELVFLKEFVEQNKTGCIKIVKKHDKVMKHEDLSQWKEQIGTEAFVVSLEPSELMEKIITLVGRDKLMEWDTLREQQLHEDEALFPRVKPMALGVSVAVFAASFLFPLYPDDKSASNCFSMLLLAICMWVSEALPYYATAVAICPLSIFLGVFKNPDTGDDALNNGSVMTPSEASTEVYENMWNHTSVLLLGGYTISSAFSRCQLELRLASWMQRRLGHRPKLFILAVMMLGLFLSTWISNTTAPILISSFITPVVRDLPSNSKFSKCLLLGLAIACNFGGMMTPISSMQNALAASYIEAAGYPVSFGSWMAVSVPFCVSCVFFSWLYLIFVIDPDDVQSISAIVYERSNIFSPKNLMVMVSSLLTIILFALSSLIIGTIGDIGVISMIYVAVMYGSGILSEVDFNSLSWHTLFLIGGGNVLGTAVTSSGLLVNISADVTAVLPMNHFWPAMVLILCFCMSVATFVSHTVAAIILLPLVVQLGTTLGNPMAVVVCAVFGISAAQGLPFSSFPNVNSLLIVDDARQPYLVVKDYLMTGLPISLITLFFISTIGLYLINTIMG